MIEIQHLTKRFENLTAVSDLSFSVETGQTLALLGSSGSGKTTTLKMINRLIEPTSGSILVDGENVLDQPIEQMRRRMGYVIQDMGLFPHYTVLENVSIVPKLLEQNDQQIRQRSLQLLERLGLSPDEYADKYPAQLSGGQQQRVGIARALAADPPIILMDEPFGALDPITRFDIRQEFIELEELSSKTTILVTHDVEEAFELADLICLLHEGNLQQLGTPHELLFEPANEFVAQFLTGQRLQLELQLLTLEDVYSFLSENVPSKETQQISTDTSIRQALQYLEKRQAPFGQAFQNGQARYFDTTTLLEAFAQAKSSNAR